MGWLLSPLSAVVVTSNELVTGTAAANEEVPVKMPLKVVSVAVTVWPMARVTGNEILNDPMSVTVVAPRQGRLAWPSPGGSPGALEKNSDPWTPHRQPLDLARCHAGAGTGRLEHEALISTINAAAVGEDRVLLNGRVFRVHRGAAVEGDDVPGAGEPTDRVL